MSFFNLIGVFADDLFRLIERYFADLSLLDDLVDFNLTNEEIMQF